MPDAAVGPVAITGAGGYIGSVLRQAFEASGECTVSLVRNPLPGDSQSRQWDLTGELKPEVLEGVRTLVHCAYDLRATSASAIREINVEGTRRLMAAARAAGVRKLVLISSMSAYRGTTQLYGRAKLACEEIALDLGGMALRLGLVYGGQWRGMGGALRKLATLPVIPLLGGDQARQYLLHEDDLARALLALLQSPVQPEDPVGLAHPVGMHFKDLVTLLAKHQGRSARFVPAPWRAAYWSMRLAELAGLPLPLRADSLLGLVRPAPYVPNVDLWEELGIRLREISSSLPVA
jgi:nucleoside-diphosphate-sugar epimerase